MVFQRIVQGTHLKISLVSKLLYFARFFRDTTLWFCKILQEPPTTNKSKEIPKLFIANVIANIIEIGSFFYLLQQNWFSCLEEKRKVLCNVTNWYHEFKFMTRQFQAPWTLFNFFFLWMLACLRIHIICYEYKTTIDVHFHRTIFIHTNAIIFTQFVHTLCIERGSVYNSC